MTRRIGAHLSTAKGLVGASQHALDIGGNCLQIFSGSPRSWARKTIDEKVTAAFKTFNTQHDVDPIVIHALYLINLASDNAELLQHSVAALRYDLRYDAAIGGGGVVVHLGSHQGRGFDAVFDQLVSTLKEILGAAPKESTLLIENSAGQNGKLCSDLHEIRQLFDALAPFVQNGQLRWCFDTCHAFCAGYKLETVEEIIEKEDLFGSLKIIHLNDSRDPFDSGRDRHDNIGKGLIGEASLRHFLNNKKFTHLPLILEVPGIDKLGPDKQNVDMVKSLISQQVY